MPGLPMQRNFIVKNLTDKQALCWAIAILRDDMRYTWRQIAQRMHCSECKVRHLYTQTKPL
jgi:hypothetical protein